jgi:hypothetical protein
MTKHTSLSIICSLLFPFIAFGQAGQAAKDSDIHIESLMTVAEFKSCGLNKLSADEIAHLDAWLRSSVKMLNTGTDTTPARRAVTSDVIESEIEGDFNGWDGETIFKLGNGQIWQQAEYDYDYEYAFQPSVTIYRTGSGYKMKVEDVEETIAVKRIK